MDTPDMTSNRPYLLRALHEWILDNGMTPYVLVNAGSQDVIVPQQHVNDGRIVLNIAPTAVRDLHIGNEFVTFSARFSGSPFHIQIPIQAVLAVYARENGKGMIFPEEDVDTAAAETEKSGPAISGKKPVLKVVK